MKHYDHFTSFKGNKITRIESQFRLNSLKRVSHKGDKLGIFSISLAMARREKQADVQPEELVLSSRLPNLIKDNFGNGICPVG
ncbi:hypothetical protein TNCV_4078041 [Trichonephila clavipes]|nr:hypothetical protein TNCV_4078041 [Trichonephila clavipes]